MGERESEVLPPFGATMPVSLQAVPQRSFLIGTISWFRDLMLSVLIAVLVILFLYRPVKVEGTSMMPSLFDQERLFINQFTYKFKLGDIKRGDTVVFWYPEDTTKSYIKRVIGLPGDTVEAMTVMCGSTAKSSTRAMFRQSTAMIAAIQSM